MNFAQLKKSGHWPTLATSFFYFDVSFMVWTMLGALGALIAPALGLSAQEKFLMVATPTLAGAFLRIALSLLVDRIGTKSTGILAQLQNLSDAGAKDPILGVAQWVVTLLFFCIEILPVTVKVLMNIGPLSTYEVLLKNEEDMIADQAKLTRVTTRRDAEREADKRIALDEHMRQLEEGLGKKANMHVANHMEQILDVALAEWSRNVQAGLSVKLPPQAQPGNTAGAPPRPVVSPRARIGITGPQPVLGGTGTQPPAGGTQPGAGYNVFNGNVFNGNAVNGNAVNGNGANGSDPNASAPTVTFLSPAAGGYAQLPDEDDGDLL